MGWVREQGQPSLLSWQHDTFNCACRHHCVSLPKPSPRTEQNGDSRASPGSEPAVGRAGHCMGQDRLPEVGLGALFLDHLCQAGRGGGGTALPTHSP